MLTSENKDEMDALPPQSLPEDLARHGAGLTFVEKQLQNSAASAIDALAMDPNRLLLLKLEDTPSGRLPMHLLEEVHHMVAAAGTPYAEGERDLSLYQKWRDLYYGECRQNSNWTNTKLKSLHPEYTHLAMIQDLLHVIKHTPDVPKAGHFGFILASVRGKSLIAKRIPDSDTISTLALYAFAHFIVPVDGHPSVVSQVTDRTIQEGIFSVLSALCNNPANTGDVRGAFLLLAMYSVLELHMPFKSRMDQMRDFFFFHIQPKQNERVKENLLHLFFLLAESDPTRYGNPEEGKAIVKHAQSVLLVSCPYISESLTLIWSQHMQSLVDAYRSKKLKDFDITWMKKEAQALITPSDPDAPRCHPSAHSVLRSRLQNSSVWCIRRRFRRRVA
ncbi:MAG: hypothetical protein LBG98_04010 [Puniceicoccales bacterium]|jgi:hypothetical protein|nr:hypothetical protein [Puniceicoccales bacterium]